MEARSITMACLLITFLLLISNIHTTLAVTSTSSKSNSLKIYKNFIKSSCNSTLYPTLCYKYLSSYASTIQTDSLKLCKAALIVNLKAANKTSSILSNITKKGLYPPEKAVTKDCIDEIYDCIDNLKQASEEMANLSTDANLDYQIADIKTFVSAAMTDEYTCTDGFDEMKVRSSVKKNISKSVMDLGKVTSITLAFINGLKY